MNSSLLFKLIVGVVVALLIGALVFAFLPFRARRPVSEVESNLSADISGTIEDNSDDSSAPASEEKIIVESEDQAIKVDEDKIIQVGDSGKGFEGLDEEREGLDELERLFEEDF